MADKKLLMQVMAFDTVVDDPLWYFRSLRLRVYDDRDHFLREFERWRKQQIVANEWQLRQSTESLSDFHLLAQRHVLSSLRTDVLGIVYRLPDKGKFERATCYTGMRSNHPWQVVFRGRWESAF